MSKFLSSVLSLALFLSFIPSAIAESSEDGKPVVPEVHLGALEMVAPLKKGEKAPFKGVLFSTAAAAKVKTEIELAPTKCRIEKEKEMSLQKAEYELNLKNYKARLEAETKRRKEITELKNEQIGSLTEELKRSTKKPKIPPGGWIAIGVLGGVLVAIAGGYIAKQVID